MNRKNTVLFATFFLSLNLSLLGCGVKGDPQPPMQLPELGRGRPTYRGATKGLKIQVEQGEDENNSESDDVE